MSNSTVQDPQVLRWLAGSFGALALFVVLALNFETSTTKLARLEGELASAQLGILQCQQQGGAAAIRRRRGSGTSRGHTTAPWRSNEAAACFGAGRDRVQPVGIPLQKADCTLVYVGP